MQESQEVPKIVGFLYLSPKIIPYITLYITIVAQETDIGTTLLTKLQALFKFYQFLHVLF